MAVDNWARGLAAAVVTYLAADSSGLMTILKKVEAGLVEITGDQIISAADCDYCSVSVPEFHGDNSEAPVGFCEFPAVLRLAFKVMQNPRLDAEQRMSDLLTQASRLMCLQKIATPFGYRTDTGRAVLLDVGPGVIEEKPKLEGRVWVVYGSQTNVCHYQMDGHTAA